MGVNLDRPLFMGIFFCKTPSIGVRLGLKQLVYFFLNRHSNPLRLRLIGQ